MSRKDWTSPAPLEIERPRLPWWTMLPKPVLTVLSPVIAVGVLAVAVNFAARRVYRYPIALTTSVGLVVLGSWHGWWWPLGVGMGAVALLAGWWWRWRDSFTRTAGAQLASEFRRARVYAIVWRRTMRLSGIARRVGRSWYYPRVRRVRADGWRDRVLVGLLHGQAPKDFEARAGELAHAFGATSCRVRVEKPRRIWLDLIHRDTLAAPVAPALLAAADAVVDLGRLVVGMVETGREFVLRLLGNHLLVVGSTGAGKSSVVWALLWALAPAIRSGHVQVFGVDPKGGMELGRASGLFTRLVYDNGPDAVELLEHVATLTRQRAAHFRESKKKAWTPGSGQPFVLLVVDELADVVAYQTDRGLKARANAALQSITSQGRAPGVCVVGQVQDPRKAVLDFRHLFPTKIAMRLDEPDQVNLALGDGARARGAAADEISEDTPGVAWVLSEGRRQIDRVRAFHLDDAYLDELDTYVRDGSGPAVLPAPARPEVAA
ncbi:FtsK/SpoIIIE domain-containing protein [Pseudonocardia sp. NPDC049154]|uniref:FtsK/SpoIIIE domain-containing protein n=1 Tax=Pseudonocardia sp. NPDC049154 TaxID=3155501 RepID=UPI0033E3B575